MGGVFRIVPHAGENAIHPRVFRREDLRGYREPNHL
jgi:hypothetical protein